MAAKQTAVKGPEDWQVESDVRTLAEAEKIKGDKKRHEKAKTRAKEMIADLQSATGEESDDEQDE